MERRAYLSATGLVVAGTIAGCIGDGNDGDESDEPDDSGSGDDEWPPSFGFRLEDEPNAGGDLSLSLEFLDAITKVTNPDDLETVQPAIVDLTVKNDGEDPLSLAFEGFVPFPDPHGVHDERSDDLLVFPVDVELADFDADTAVPEYERVDDYWEVTTPVDRPESTTELTLDPGDTVGGEHVFIAAEGHLEEEGGGPSGPNLGVYTFESVLPVVPDDGDPYEVELEFSVRVTYTDP